MAVPQKAPTDAITDHVIGVFYAANRARRYLAGMNGAIAMPLSSVEIGQAVNAYGSPLARPELDACVFALDREYLDRAASG
ncbi:hypothetical protein L1889_18335 [Paenalcaligenes niemegkensis]|uniref:hypothetical protein n=1 Tax=Paenalcaligenes niemegkensis TaxID=2895469 RepID=UPI001EE8CB56|nr:hypothetical protein [Paenalcaligenes niemegkensis]MCQ9618399.1 hypothetical protein [Paenalcaligenes niemegkensis]